MIKLSLTISFLSLSLLSYAQDTPKLDNDTSHFKNAPLYILQLPLSNPIEATGIFTKPEHIESINVFKDAGTIQEYGQKASNGLIIIKLNRSSKILTLGQLLTMYQVTSKNLPVFVDSTRANKPDTYLFEPEMVKSAKIETEKETGMKYISIVTLSPVHRSKTDETYIK